MTDNLTITLKTPVVVDGETITALTLTELTVDDTILLEKQHGTKPTTEQDKFMFAQACGVVPDVIGKLKQRDWLRLKTRYWETLGNAESEDETSE